MMIYNNLMSLHILNIMDRTQSALMKNMQRLATGRRINSAADDPSGYAIMQRMEMEIRSLDQASSNAQRSKSMLKVGEGSAQSTVDILTTLKEKALAASNSTATDVDRATMQKEFDQLIDQIDDNALTSYNGKYLMDGSHNSQVMHATTESFTNRSLSTSARADSLLTGLSRRDGDKLNISSSDSVTISYVKQGKTYTTTFQAGSHTLADIFKKANGLAGGTVFSTNIGMNSVIGTDAFGKQLFTPDGDSAVTVRAEASGTSNSLAGFTVSISDAAGKMKKDVNTVLDAFSESIQARNPSADNSLVMQTGSHAGQTIKAPLGDMRATALGLKGIDGTVLNISTREGANAALSVLDTAISRALDQQTTIGAMENRLDYTIANLTSQSENLTSALSTIADTDMAKEMTEFVKNNILLQAAQAMLAQSNQNAYWILELLK